MAWRWIVYRRQAIIWTSADPIHWHIYAALGGDELTVLSYQHQAQWWLYNVVYIFYKNSSPIGDMESPIFNQMTSFEMADELLGVRTSHWVLNGQ